jgi:hypothetical protein
MHEGLLRNSAAALQAWIIFKSLDQTHERDQRFREELTSGLIEQASLAIELVCCTTDQHFQARHDVDVEDR